MTGQPVMDCAVVGAGTAGLVVSAALTVRGVDHVVLDRAAETWHRRVGFLPAEPWMNQMLGS
jgi:cation diffusion facilitator CzcD-associated flavoprotein CzcO